MRQDRGERRATQRGFADEVDDGVILGLPAVAPGPADTEAGTVLVAPPDIVRASNEATGTLPVTPARTEGRYYPCAPVADNDDVGVP